LPASKLIPPGSTNQAGLEIDDYDWSADGKRLLIFTNTKKVWRQNTRGDYWVLDVAAERLKKLGGDAPESSLMFAKFSPDNSRVAYTRANNIYVEQLGSGTITPLTRDGSTTTINGTSDWVYEEELDVRDGFRWSPDSQRIAGSSTRPASRCSRSSTTRRRSTRHHPYPYPKAGTTNSAVRIGVASVGGSATQWMNIPGQPRDNYLARLEWLDRNTVAIQQLNRLQNQDDFYLADATTGAATRVFRDMSNTWVDVVDDVRWTSGTPKSFLWISERDGWRHVYRVPRVGGQGTSITRFDADVIDVVGTDEAEGWLYFLASPSNATERYLYRSKLDGSGAPERVTPADQKGTHAYDLAPGGRMAFHTWSQFDRHPVMDVVALPAHRS
jgi:dipeptidyl-peptidase-4